MEIFSLIIILNGVQKVFAPSIFWLTDFSRFFEKVKMMKKKKDQPISDEAQRSKKIEVLQEDLVVGKKEIETGKIVLTKNVLEEEVPLNLSGFEEDLEVKVNKVGQLMDEPGPAIRTEGDSTVYSVYREVYVKKVILEEEVWVTKKVKNRSFEDLEKLKREEIIVGRVSKKPPRE